MTEIEKEKIIAGFNNRYNLRNDPTTTKVRDFLLDETQKPFRFRFNNNYDYSDVLKIVQDIAFERLMEIYFYEDNFSYFSHKHFWIIIPLIDKILAFSNKEYEIKLVQFMENIPREESIYQRGAYKELYLYNQDKYKKTFIDFLKKVVFYQEIMNYDNFIIDYCHELQQFIDEKEYKTIVIEALKKQLIGLYDRDLYSRRDNDVVSIAMLKELKTLLNSDEFEMVFRDYTCNSNIHEGYLKFLQINFQDDLFEYLAIILNRTPDDFDWSELINLYDLLIDIDYTDFYSLVWKFTSKLSFCDINNYAILPLNSHSTLAKQYALKGLQSKNKKERYLSLKILFNQFDKLTKEDKNELLQAMHIENDDKDIRSSFINLTVEKLYPEEMNIKQVDEIIEYAQKRKKLNKWKESFAIEDLPAIYFKSGQQLTPLQLHFLFYRMQQAYEMQQDVEAMLLINLIDKQKSQEAIKFLLQYFISNGGKAKEKYLMSLAALLGDENLFDFLEKLFHEVFNDKRMKMAQFVIGAIALIGSDQALRFIDFISKKHKKKTALREYCLESLDNAAKALNLTRNELYDKLIPDFGFDGIYKSIDIEGEEWRVYVGKDFKLYYIDESNKIRKSIPAKATKELKDELKAVQKEIREVNKTQLDKLEQYMVTERTWDSESWQKFYMNNPLMFIYASTLVWELSDENKNQEMLFYIDEDGSAMSIDGDELLFEEMENKIIKIIHPLYLTPEQKQEWQTLFYDLEIVQPFLQLQRPSFFIEENEKATKGLNRYNNKKFAKGESAIKTLLEKRGYEKDVVDGGGIDFYKNFEHCGIRVELGVYGINVVYYEGGGDLEISETVFKDEENNPIALENIPKIVFSETIYDLDSFMED